MRANQDCSVQNRPTRNHHIFSVSIL